MNGAAPAGDGANNDDEATGYARSSATIICSDCTRNGKTLFAKLVADLLTLRNGEPPVLFDMDAPDGSLVNRFGGLDDTTRRIIDITRTPQHVSMFDGMLGGGHFVIDLSARDLRRFFKIYRDIGFEKGAREAGLSVSVFFLIDRTEQSLRAALDLSVSLPDTRFVPVRNEAFGDALDNPDLATAYRRLALEREIVLPQLTGEALAMVDHPDFHFDAFIAGRYDNFPPDLKAELWMLMETLYAQRESSGDVVVHPV